MTDPERAQTYGEKAVGLTFNPSGMGDVDKLKKLYAQIIDHMDDFRKGYIARKDPKESEMIRLCSVAITEAQTAQMWAVKTVTFRP